MRGADVYERERELPAAAAAGHVEDIRRFISDASARCVYLVTFRRDGRPVSRPVAAFVDGWRIHTITQAVHVKTSHVRHHPTAGYLFVGLEPYRTTSPAPHLQNVWVEGHAELVEDRAAIDAFYERRRQATGRGDPHAGDTGWRPLLISVTPRYLRAEGFAGGLHPVVLREGEFGALR
ncbi:MAG: pyridoxamine 5'-phosphate oxidase family protein [Chloroflexi bacterium]|nr:pyridoxamine 5'-phosphate oxidase family protein [Chloroflexota bacterium]